MRRHTSHIGADKYLQDSRFIIANQTYYWKSIATAIFNGTSTTFGLISEWSEMIFNSVINLVLQALLIITAIN